ncbi:unnamed protein product [Spirodela intermedia]|uniref:apyrase n=1 Tax=Spirodela intermedia TaxID=51605 RepID=A0A7I8IY31_SPIIN|nr:unnamed protein product [Spirodela intermedia]CAA6661911.1 unnamed protein product [Spirodela intermedia]
MQGRRSMTLNDSGPLLLISSVFFFFLVTGGGGVASAGGRKIAAGGGGAERYAVIFDAGSSGTRVHVYCFDSELRLLPIGEDLELYVKTKPGLSAYASDPEEAANSLLPLMEKAEAAVPVETRENTPVRVGATAGLRSLGTEKSEQILEAIRALLQEKSSFSFQPEWVSVLSGTQEGKYMWVTINYLLGRLGKAYPHTAGVVDLGGGSVQMAYAVSSTNAAKAPPAKDGKDGYVNEFSLKGAEYNLYVHSYLNYGLLAARAEILKVGGGSGRSCILEGYEGSYNYGGETYNASASASGSSFAKCRRAAVKALNVDAPCETLNCTFSGVWNGGGGAGQRDLFLASFFFDKAAQADFIDPTATTAKATPSDFKNAAKRACGMNLATANSTYSAVWPEDLPFICMDLVYQYSLLVDGFGAIRNFYGEAAWPLGSAIDAITSSTNGHADN